MPTPLISALSPSFEIDCPRCGGGLVYDDVLFAGLPILVESRCLACGGAYLLDWPAGHALLHPTIIDVGSGEVFFDGAEWYPRALKSLVESRPDAAPVPAVVKTREPAHRNAVLVNCVDYVYGHCLLKLLSGLRFVNDGADADVIVVAQKPVSWLLPSTVHTVVELDLPLRDGTRWLGGLDETIKELLGRYASVQIAPTPSQPRLTADDLGLAAPHLAPSLFWEEGSSGAPQVTLLLREDRLWARRPLRLGPGRLPGVLGRLRNALALRAQNHRFARVVRHVHAAVPEVRFVAVGLGRTGRLPEAVIDLRKTTIEPTDELAWCGEYTRSRVVIGVHGSHLLLPSALAGAVIDLLPAQKLPNLAQDLIIAGESESEPKLCLFRYRILPLQVDPATVAETVVSIIRDADRHHLNMIRNRDATGEDWPRPFSWRRLDPGPASHDQQQGGGPPAAPGTERAADGVPLRAGVGPNGGGSGV